MALEEGRGTSGAGWSDNWPGCCGREGTSARRPGRARRPWADPIAAVIALICDRSKEDRLGEAPQLGSQLLPLPPPRRHLGHRSMLEGRCGTQRSEITCAVFGATGPRARRGRRSRPPRSPAAVDTSSQPPVQSQKRCQASATRLLEAGAAPVGGALGDPVGGEEEGRPGPGSGPRRPARSSQWVSADRHAVHEHVAVVVWTAWRTSASPAMSTKVAGRRLELVDRVVGDGAVVDAEALDELGVARRGEPDDLDARRAARAGRPRRSRSCSTRSRSRSARARRVPRRRAGRRSGTR